MFFFFVFEHLIPPPPLGRSQAKSCLVDFVDKAAAALEAVHGLGYAHLDVRLQNICFSDCLQRHQHCRPGGGADSRPQSQSRHKKPQ